MQYVCRQASSREEKKQAREIVLAEYVRSGYITEEAFHSGNADILPSDQALHSDQGMTLVIPFEERIIGTVSVVLDSPGGFPMDSLYHTELEKLRHSGCRLAEVVQLATDKTFISELSSVGAELSLLLSLFQGLIRIGKEKDIDGLCITVNPKHDRFYTEIGFVAIGPERQYAALEGAPALPKVLYWKKSLQNAKDKGGILHLLSGEL